MSELMPRFRWSGLRNWVIYGAKLRACPSLRLAGFIVEIFNLSNSIRFPLPHLHQRRRGEGGSLCDSSLYLVGCLPPLLIDWMKSFPYCYLRINSGAELVLDPPDQSFGGVGNNSKKKKRVRKAISVELWAKHLAHPGKKNIMFAQPTEDNKLNYCNAKSNEANGFPQFARINWGDCGNWLLLGVSLFLSTNFTKQSKHSSVPPCRVIFTSNV